MNIQVAHRVVPSEPGSVTATIRTTGHRRTVNGNEFVVRGQRACTDDAGREGAAGECSNSDLFESHRALGHATGRRRQCERLADSCYGTPITNRERTA